MGGCFGSGQPAREPVKTEKISKLEEVDFIKSKLKVTRDRIDNLTSQYQAELDSVNQEIEREKETGLKNKPKALYLLKQRKDFQEQIGNLTTRKQVVSKTLSSLAQQQLDQQMVVVLQQSNEYMRKVEEELERKNWREVLAEAQNNKYNTIDFREAEEDPDVDRLFAELEQQVTEEKTVPAKVEFLQPVRAKQLPPLKRKESREVEYS